MAVKPDITFKAIDDLNLDPNNPRLGRAEVAKGLSQAQVLDILKTWSLFELAQSMARHGFWPQEALLVVEESLQGAPATIVVEGNRRLAAAKLLLAAQNGAPMNAAWAALVRDADAAVLDSLRLLPCILADSREDADAFLGYRHVTGIKEWHPAEKAEFITHLVEHRGMSFKEVAETIGSKGKVVARNHLTYRMLMQLEDEGLVEEASEIESKFSVLFLALRNAHVRNFVGVAEELDATSPAPPVDPANLGHLRDLVGWMFGTSHRQKVLKESREVDKFAFVLTSDRALKYLRSSPQPHLDVAYRLAGGEGADVVELLESAAISVEQALSVLAHHADEAQVVEAAKRLATDLRQVANTIPAVRVQLCPGNSP